MRLQLPGLGAFHLVADSLDVGRAHDVADQRALVDDLAQGVAHSRVTPRSELALHLGLLAVADRLDQQVAQALAAEGLAENVEDLTAERLALLIQLLEEPLEDLALARLLGHQVPQVADLGLADAVDPAEPLLDAVRVPRQVVVDHEVRALKVDALARRVGRDEHQDVRVLHERFLDLPALLAGHAAVDRDDRFRPAEQVRSLLDEVVQGVAVLAEHDQLPPVAVASNISGCRCRRLRQLLPFAVRARVADLTGQLLEVGQGGDLVLELGDRAARRTPGRPARSSSSSSSPSGRSSTSKSSSIRKASGTRRRAKLSGELGAAPANPLLPSRALQALAATSERLVDRFRRRSQATLQVVSANPTTAPRRPSPSP